MSPSISRRSPTSPVTTGTPAARLSTILSGERAAATASSHTGSTEQDAQLSSVIRSLGPALMDETARIVREVPPEEIARMAVTLREGATFGDPDDEETAARVALLAPAFLALVNLMGPILTASGRKRRLPGPS